MVVLVVDDDASFNELISRYLRKEKFEVISVLSASTALRTLQEKVIDLVLADYKMPEMDGIELIEAIQKLYPDLPVILMTNYADIRVAVNSIKVGAFDFVSKPIIPDELLKIVHLALTKDATKSSSSLQKKTSYVKGKNEQTEKLWKHLAMVAPTKMNVLITGESGTGKEYIACTIHEMSRRANGPFVAVDCGALTVELAGSELFGHVKGAFTGAQSDKRGLFEVANGGTLFLDEIGNLPHEIQILLLRAIQEEQIKRVGGTQDIPVDVRIVAATNEMLIDNVQKQIFRNDLYHRLNEFELYLAPLRERLDDLEEFVEFFITEACEEFNRPLMKISQEVQQVFLQYSWPGNLRELRNIIRRSVILTLGDTIELDVLPAGLLESQKSEAVESLSVSEPVSLDIKTHQQELEKKMLMEALEKYKFNKSKAAQALHIDRSTLYKKLKQYNIDL